MAIDIDYNKVETATSKGGIIITEIVN